MECVWRSKGVTVQTSLGPGSPVKDCGFYFGLDGDTRGFEQRRDGL